MKHHDFETTTHAKWILAGEHAVLRGCPALVFPIPERKLKMVYQEDNMHQVDFKTPFGETLLIFFWELLRKSSQKLGKNIDSVSGRFFLENNIRMGGGMGFSAALCVAVTRWLIWKNWLREEDLFEFSRSLEDSFHGKSSGIDIIGAISSQGLYYKIDGEQHPIRMTWKPHFRLTYSNHIRLTKSCVERVTQFYIDNKEPAKLIDNVMEQSVILAEQALMTNKKEGLLMLADAVNRAYYCFEQWGLVNDELKVHIKQLLEAGALAAKPTGSGDGGYVLSLWPEDISPSDELDSINLF